MNEKYIELNSEGWYKLIHYIFDDVIKEEFNLVPIKKGCWADSYNESKRRVISLFLINDRYATFKWGWNFEYIPRYTSKIIWCKTDKSVYTHTFEVATQFAACEQDHHKVVFGRNEYHSKNNYKGFQQFLKYYLKVWDSVYEQIKEYYSATSTYEGLLKRLH